MSDISFAFQLGNPVVYYDYGIGIVSSFPGIGKGEDAMWLVRDAEYFGGRPMWVPQGKLRHMKPEDLAPNGGPVPTSE